MITARGTVQPSQKKKGKEKSRKQKARADKGREKAVERSAVLSEKVKGREERKVRKVCSCTGVASLEQSQSWCDVIGRGDGMLMSRQSGHVLRRRGSDVQIGGFLAPALAPMEQYYP